MVTNSVNPSRLDSCCSRTNNVKWISTDKPDARHIFVAEGLASLFAQMMVDRWIRLENFNLLNSDETLED
jgi:hypothetical protein